MPTNSLALSNPRFNAKFGAEMSAKRKPATSPPHLRKATRGWFENVVSLYELDEHHLRLLTLAAEAWDRGEQAREALATGLTYTDRFGSPKARPEVAIERDSRVAFARLLRELDLDAAPPPESSRPPAIGTNRR